MSRFVYVIIPARLQSTRLHEKPLQMLGTQTLIQCVYARALELKERLVGMGCRVIVHIATNSPRVAELFEPGVAILTSDTCLSGTDRIYEAIGSKLDQDDIVLNIQGDEPFFSISDVGNLVEYMMLSPKTPMATLGFKNNSMKDFMDPNVVKIALRRDATACYFSRAAIPWPRDHMMHLPKTTPTTATPVAFVQHVGVYAFRGDSLKDFIHNLPRSLLEEAECLEQLRAVEAGWQIFVLSAAVPSFGIDTPHDLQNARKRISQ